MYIYTSHVNRCILYMWVCKFVGRCVFTCIKWLKSWVIVWEDDYLKRFNEFGSWDFCSFGCKDSGLWTPSLAVHQSMNWWRKRGRGCLSGLDSQEDVAEISVPRLSVVLFNHWDKHSDSEHLPKPAQVFCLTAHHECRKFFELLWHPGNCHDTQTRRVQHVKHAVIPAGPQKILPIKWLGTTIGSPSCSKSPIYERAF